MPAHSKHASVLPDEMLLLIAEQLPTPDLLNFVLVNSVYHCVGTSVLLRPLRSVPLFEEHENPDGITFYSLNPCLFNDDYTAQIRSVTVRPHRRTYCPHVDLLDLQRVDILRVFRNCDPFGGWWSMHHDDVTVFRRWEPTGHVTCHGVRREVECPLLNLASARTLVTRGSIYNATPISSVLPPAIAQSIQSVVLLLRPPQTPTCSVAYSEIVDDK